MRKLLFSLSLSSFNIFCEDMYAAEWGGVADSAIEGGWDLIMGIGVARDENLLFW